ncbi:hypothetical protein DSOUD_2333 [Desulfuromonas soudanensis]|uniref:Uncharacterized protein n=1 Tax=Desulfuromonas soudanensis TaxID=1603606 RepID=A0A0M4DJ66_9BACT|nr:hypothetical protein [Desulfuromonas soudanensis]ALC17095.1 hypothetical protein DSOUD_2333 [Desulfuromonas soudanensis]
MNRRRSVRIFAPLALLLLCGVPAAGSDTLHFSGFVKSLNMHLQSPPVSADLSANRLRLDLEAEPRPGVGVELSAESLLYYSDPAALLPLPRSSTNRRLDLEADRDGDEHFKQQLSIDRLNLSATLGGIDWVAGRQAIGFGRILLFSPLDVIAPFPPDALDAEVRPGVDALKGVRYFGLGGQLGGTVVFGDEKRNNAWLATVSYNLRGIDILALGGVLREREMIGAGLAGSLGGLGLKGEISVYDGKDVGLAGGDRENRFAIGAAEGWYRFDSGLVLIAEYLYNGAGANEPADYPQVAASAPFVEGLSFLLGRHYLLLGPSWEAHPLVTLNALVISNLTDGSLLLRPLLDISLADNFDLQLFWSFTGGKKPAPTLSFSVPRSEFGSVGDSGGVFLKYFF